MFAKIVKERKNLPIIQNNRVGSVKVDRFSAFTLDWNLSTTKIPKVLQNNSDNNMVAKKNYGLKGGEVRAARPNKATTSADLIGNLTTQLARTPK